MRSFLSSKRYKKAKEDALELLSYYVNVRTFFVGYTDNNTFEVDNVLNFNGCKLYEGTTKDLEDSY